MTLLSSNFVYVKSVAGDPKSETNFYLFPPTAKRILHSSSLIGLWLQTKDAYVTLFSICTSYFVMNLMMSVCLTSASLLCANLHYSLLRAGFHALLPYSPLMSASMERLFPAGMKIWLALKYAGRGGRLLPYFWCCYRSWVVYYSDTDGLLVCLVSTLDCLLVGTLSEV